MDRNRIFNTRIHLHTAGRTTGSTRSTPVWILPSNIHNMVGIKALSVSLSDLAPGVMDLNKRYYITCNLIGHCTAQPVFNGIRTNVLCNVETTSIRYAPAFPYVNTYRLPINQEPLLTTHELYGSIHTLALELRDELFNLVNPALITADWSITILVQTRAEQ